MKKPLPNWYFFYGLLQKTCLCFVLMLGCAGYAQSKEKLYSFNWKNTTVLNAFKEVENVAAVHFSYNPLDLNLKEKIDLSIENKKLSEVLNAISTKINIRYQINGKTIMIQSYTPPPVTKPMQFVLTGKVTDEKKVGIPGVIVLNTVTDKTTTTNAQGDFFIQAGKGDMIRFKMLGFQAAALLANEAQKSVTIVLKEEINQLNETVVTALGIKREERSLGYAVAAVDGKGLKKAREINVINSLAGKVPGLIINGTAGGPTAASRVIIRGSTSVTGNNQPLYVVDGIPIDNSNYGGTGGGLYASGVDMGDAISAINPDDIETINVLKGASASALYGSRAANGVILITTKRGKGADLGIEFNSTSSIESQLTSYDGYQSLYGQGTRQLINTLAIQDYNTLTKSFGARIDPDLSVITGTGARVPYAYVKNNIDGFFKTGSTFTNTLSFTNGNENSSFRFSAANLTNKDIIPESGINRNSFTFNGSSKFGQKVTLEARAFYMNEKVDNRPSLADDPANIGNSFLSLANTVDQARFANEYKNADGSYLDWNNGNQYRLNPYWVINEMKNETTKDRLIASAQLNYNILTWLSLQGRASSDQTYVNYEKFSPKTTPGALTGTLDQNNSKYNTIEADALLTAQKQLTPSLNLSARLGSSITRNRRTGNVMQFTNQAVTDVNIPTSYTQQSVTPVANRRSINSVYGIVAAGYKGWLYADATLRQDVFSTLPEQNNSKLFPSLSTAFIFTDAFKLDKKILSFGKFRASVAQVASDTDPFLIDQYYRSNSMSFNGLPTGGLSTDVKSSSTLKPTITSSYEFGTELKFFNNRIGIDLTYYNSKSKDQLNIVPTPPSSGYKAEIINAGVISNEGIEIAFNATPIATKNFNWSLNISFARNQNNVESLAEGTPFLTLSDARWMGVSVVAMPGTSYGSLLGYDYQRDPSGNIILSSVDLQPLLSTNRAVMGKGIYDWTGGLSSTMTYKNFSLEAVLDVKYGADLLSLTNYFAAANGSSISTLEGRAEWIKSEEDRQAAGQTPAQWAASGLTRGYVPQGVIQTGTNTDGTPIYTQNTRAIDPSIYWGALGDISNSVGRPFIYDASYIKMRQLTLSYRLPETLTAKWGVKDVQVALVARNPFIIYKNVPNVDPDSNYSNGNGQGVEYGSLPGRRSFGFNLNFRF
ncbi:SusC/RagA family TonB-linked outer membrane protein [Pedobacter sp. MC2016-14]|uniref:SusC/RagA family TonB-linked outer membrane protein n=1 Tax=Pedobacter sp. MC2016-14 TaxID=2897327 RepID=UPI001E6140AA|nr:SusC/RagA family TonB-linked outer membrane protein [Pedobacter sp. MC2016-14]MCD0488165.1 SusC/RagA family TonB-linked outer membrane protein [Pedobacter sp. MC2016-14]